MKKIIFFLILVILIIMTGCSKKHILNLTRKDGLLNDAVYNFKTDGKYTWIGYGMLGFGATRYDNETGEMKHYTTLEKPGSFYVNKGGVVDIDTDENYVWFAISFGGIRRLDKKTEEWKVITDRDGLASMKVSRIRNNGNDLYIGYFDYGYSILNKNNFIFRHVKIQNSKADKESASLIKFKFIKNNLNYIGTLRKGIFKIFSLNRYEQIKEIEDSDILDFELLNNKIIYSIPNKKNFYRGGIMIYSLDDKTLYNLEDLENIFLDQEGIEAIKVINGNIILFLTTKHGLCRYNFETKDKHFFTHKDGLLKDTHYYSLYVDDKYVWVGFPTGLSRIDKEWVLNVK